MKRLAVPLLLVVIILVSVKPAYAQEKTLAVYYAGPDGSVKTALQLAKFTLVDNPAKADVILLNGVFPDPRAFMEALDANTGFVLILGEEIASETALSLFGAAVSLTPHEDAVSLEVNKKAQDGIVTDVLWSSAPQIRARQELTDIGLEPLVTAYETDEVLLGKNGNFYLLTAFLDGNNSQFQEWPYFNYLIYNLAMRAGGRRPVAFGDYAAAPLPQPHQRVKLIQTEASE